MKTMQLNVVAAALLIPFMIIVANNTPDEWSEGPFNHDLSKGFFSDEGLVPNTLYHNNKTEFVTVWDESQRKYVTYDQKSGERQPQVVFNAVEINGGKEREGRTLVAGYQYRGDRSGGGRVAMVGGKVAPTTHLDEEGMKIQAEYGCSGCHTL